MIMTKEVKLEIDKPINPTNVDEIIYRKNSTFLVNSCSHRHNAFFISTCLVEKRALFINLFIST